MEQVESGALFLSPSCQYSGGDFGHVPETASVDLRRKVLVNRLRYARAVPGAKTVFDADLFY